MLLFIIFIFTFFTATCSQNAGNVYRPCPNFNRACIGQYLSRNSYCTFTNGQNAREPFYVPVRELDVPVSNLTIICLDVYYSNVLTGVVEEFFVDYASGYTVLSMIFKNFTINVTEARYETNRRANIPLVEITPTSLNYPKVAVTTVFPSTYELDLSKVRSTVYILIDPDLQAQYIGEALQSIYKNLIVGAREAFLNTGRLLARTFIQNTLCDFGIGPNDLGPDN